MGEPLLINFTRSHARRARHQYAWVIKCSIVRPVLTALVIKHSLPVTALHYTQFLTREKYGVHRISNVI